MSQVVYSTLRPHPDCLSDEAALLLAQLVAVHEQLEGALREMTPAQLGWQPAPGMNTIGMLAAHTAVAEAHLAQIGLHGEASGHVHDVLDGFRAEDLATDGAPGFAPPAALTGKDAGFYMGLLRAALVHSTAVVRTLEPADLDREIERPAAGGGKRVLNVRWVLHHMIEHLVGHDGQIRLLRHLYRNAHP